MCILLYIRRLRMVFRCKHFLDIHNLKSNFDNILNITKSFLKSFTDADGKIKFDHIHDKASLKKIHVLKLLGAELRGTEARRQPIFDP
jgi:hypothetical protein